MKNKNTIFSLVVILLFVGGLILLAAPKDRSAEGGAASVSGLTANVLSASETFFDFGKISMAGGVVNHAFKVKNKAGEPVKISKIYTSCMGTTAQIMAAEKEMGPFGMPGHGFVPPANVTVAAGEEFEVTAFFNPNAHGPAGVGRNDRSVYLETAAGEALEFQFTAYVTP